MQDKIKINNVEIVQPDSGGLQYSFKKTYSDDTKETQDGTLHGTVVSVHEVLGYTATGIPVSKLNTLIPTIVSNNTFSLHYFSAYFGTWRTDTFRVPEGSLSIGSLSENGELMDSVSFTMEGVNNVL